MNSFPVRILILTAAALAAFLIATHPSSSAMACGPHEKLTKALTGKYKETRKGLGLVASRRVMEVFASKSGSWTLVMTDLNGVSCIIAAGHSWEDVPPPTEPEH